MASVELRPPELTLVPITKPFAEAFRLVVCILITIMVYLLQFILAKPKVLTVTEPGIWVDSNPSPPVQF